MSSILERKTIQEILELSPHPSLEEVKKNFKRLVKQWHPDVNKSPEAEEYMKRLNWAYQKGLAYFANPQRYQQPQVQRSQSYVVIIRVNVYGSSNTTFTYDEY
jgi:pantothenate kinase